jgi:DNA mismatch repair protein MutS
MYLNKFISNLDLFKSHTKTSIENNYFKPIINTDFNKSFIDAKNIRHPIIELLITDSEYVVNDISINEDKTGILLYGINSGGKSSLMKSLGLNLILAQIGCYTASTKFEYYPYTNLFTRIDHSDNIFKGQSSFEKEILELKTILNYSNDSSLILGDEILNSTESTSAISIIGASINILLKKNISFIFASHLHKIPDYINKEVLNKLYICHLQTDYDNINNCFIYNRKLQSGISITNYGLIVAKALLNNTDIINSALNIQNKILNNNKELLEIKKSKYNSELYLNKCYICSDLQVKKEIENEVLDCHHIIFQKDFINNKCIIDNKEFIKKNNKSNLVVLCKFHHQEVHKKNIKINSWKETTNGIKLDYIIH